MPNNERMIMEDNQEKDLYKGRPDYYPYNQEWLDDYFEERASSKESWKGNFSQPS